MEYEKLSKLFYKKDEEFYKNELSKRKNSYGSYLTPLTINGFRKGKKISETYQLFYVNIHKLMSLNNKVLINSSKISALISKLPNFVIEPYFHKLIINEAQSNNEIEGIRSTKKELKEVLGDLMKSEKKKKRFKGLMKTYLFIDEIKSFTEIADFRELYDNLVSDEIAKEDIPDGELFRKGYVEINDGINTTHIGVSSEGKIVESLNALINYLDDEQHSELYRYMVAHYYYEYIHPFYDGNGRTGRLLVCSYLSRYLERYSAITFSYAVNKNKLKYYNALEEIPSPLNQGDMTFYLKDMLELLSAGQEGIIDDLEINLSKMERIKNYFKSNNWSDQEEEADLLKIMTYLNVFVDAEANFPVTRLMELSKKSRYKLNQIMNNLNEAGYVQLVSQRPKEYKVTDEFLESILIV
ncbi:Fic family protein [Fictibacillus fluitans]|uniref:Fic family protein n=1 Tax=Fictibacillus fluitans TaxID=3058422 RepID=A0ABT8I279_9BACL|nr:Fic family protein [Fictibacillus sp. NE201]MDN4527139.1 Fic family protein [Fictibacillus sp. NE201]